MDLDTITVADFKERFYRDFQYAEVPEGAEQAPYDPAFVQNRDIETAFTAAQALFNQELLTTDRFITEAYLLLSAHCLCGNIQASISGIAGGSSFPVASRSVGSVSESYVVPDAYKDNPFLAQYTTTKYGLQYLTMVLPATTGNVRAIAGYTHP